MPDVDTSSTTPLDLVSRAVPDSALGPERTEAEEKARRLSLVQRSITALTDIHEKLGMISKALGGVLPEVLREVAIGDACDMVSDLSKLIDSIAGDSGSAKAVKGRITFVKETTMPELLDAAKVKTFNTEKYRVTKTTGVFASVNGEYGVHTEGPFAGQPKAWDWLRANGYESLIKPTVNASSLAAVAKELMEEGRELPEDQFKVTPKVSISITKK
jgi:hypothetical protein